MGEWAQDLRLAWRRLAKAKGFTLASLAVLALGMGVNVALFALIDGIFLRPLPYGDPARLMRLEAARDDVGLWLLHGNLAELQRRAGFRFEFAQMIEQRNARLQEDGGGNVVACGVTSNLFDVLGVRPQLGRGFAPGENEPGRGRVVVLSDAVWRGQFHADRSILGRQIRIRGEEYSVIGVAPKGFSYPYAQSERWSHQIWTPAPMSSAAADSLSAAEGAVGIETILRLPQGVSPEAASEQLRRLQATLAAADKNIPQNVTLKNYQESLNASAAKPLRLMSAVIFAIWLLACLNVAGLMLARTLERRREMAVCAALGAGRWRLMRQAIAESLWLSFGGAVCAEGLAWATLHLLRHRLERSVPMMSAVAMDWRAFVATLLLSLLTAFAVGLYPAWRAAGAEAHADLQGASSTGARAHLRLRGALIVGQMAITLMLLMGAGLFLRTIAALRATPLGFYQQNVLTGGVVLSQNGFFDPSKPDASPDVVQTIYQPLLEKLRAMPGVQSASLSSVLPMNSSFTVGVAMGIEGVTKSSDREPRANGRISSWGLTETLGAPMIAGRFFNASDVSNAPAVVVVNEAFVKAYMQGLNPLERSLTMGPGKSARIVGVIADMKQTRVDKPSEPEVYFCLNQVTKSSMMYGVARAFMQVAVRSSQPAGLLRAQVEKTLSEVDPEAVAVGVKTMSESVEDTFGDQLMVGYLLTGFAALAMLISGIGLHALLSCSVEARRREIGIRLALGAERAQVAALVTRQASLLLALGLAIGAAASWFAARLAASYLYGVQAHDAATYALAFVTLAVVGLLSAALPARRASSVDPMQALRSE